jgi:uncharacterized repeat protein (TIGR03803 family)
MKKTLFFCICFLCSTWAKSQTYILYGTTYGGGTNGNGIVFSYNISSGKENVLINFDTLNGTGPLGNLVEDTTSKLLYATTYGGGADNYGTMFSYNPLTNTDSTLFMFNGSNGKWPGQGTLTAYNSNIYGMTNGGGKYGFGTLFSYNKASGKDSVIVNFDTSSGKEYSPLGTSLTIYPPDGLLYGMTYSGGKNNMGSIFSFNPATGKDSVMVSLDNSTGTQPEEGTLVLDPVNKMFYGVTSSGGVYNNGVLFRYDPLKNKDSAIINFNVLNGTNPYGGIMFDSLNSLFYGMTNSGGLYDYGVLYSFDPVSGKQKIVFNFNDTLGSSPSGNVTLGPNGKLYGLTNNDQNGNGTLFAYDPSTSTYNVLFYFNYTNGSGPYGSLTLAKAPVVASINKIIHQKKTSIYPNPFKTEARVSFTEDGVHYIEMDNLEGEIIRSVKCNANSYLLQREQIAAGMYIVKTYDEEHSFITASKIIVQ